MLKRPPENFLKRPPGNFCLVCQQRVTVSPGLITRGRVEPAILENEDGQMVPGWIHADCLGEDDTFSS